MSTKRTQAIAVESRRVSLPLRGVALALLLAGCSDAFGDANDADDVAMAANAATSTRVWSKLTPSGKTLTVESAQPLLVNAPFYGIEVKRNGIDITDDIVDVETLSPTAVRYTFATQTVDRRGDTIAVSLDNRQRASAGHYVAVRENGDGSTPESMFEMLSDCQTGNKGQCAGDAPVPGLLAAVQGLSRRYSPRDLETPTGYDFSPIFADAAFLASKGKKLHVIFTVRSFATSKAYDGNGTTKAFDIPGGWDKGRDREVHVYVDDVPTPFTFNSTRTQVVLSKPPPARAGIVKVFHARDPFPEYTWKMDPPVGGWFEPEGGKNFGFVHAPWRSTCVEWMRSLMGGFRKQWTAAISKNAQLADAVDAISIQETANGLFGPGYSESAYRAGLLEYTKIYARAVRGRAIHGQMINQIAGGGSDALADLAVAIAPWGARLEGPDLFNNNTGNNGNSGLEFGVYERVHREQHDLAPTMIWAQNDTYSEPKPGGGFFTMAQQFEKAQRGVTERTPGGHLGLEAESVFWNMTREGAGYGWKDALPVIASHPVIQETGTRRNLWRLESTKSPIANQSLTQTNR